MTALLRQHIRDWVKAKRHGVLPPALWETRKWLRSTTCTHEAMTCICPSVSYEDGRKGGTDPLCPDHGHEQPANSAPSRQSGETS